jgi:hypothetical protein
MLDNMMETLEVIGVIWLLHMCSNTNYIRALNALYGCTDNCFRFGSGILLLVFASTAIFGSGPSWTHDHIFMSHNSDWVITLGA